MSATETEIKRFGISENDAKHFCDLIRLSEKDYELLYGFEKDNPHIYVKFNKEFSAQHVDLIMKVAVDQLNARVRRQQEWDRLRGETTIQGERH